MIKHLTNLLACFFLTSSLLYFNKIYAQAPAGVTSSNQSTINGRIIDLKTKEPLVGVSVNLKGTTHSVTSDDNGKFVINAPTGGTLVMRNFR
jgi:hypothetical protein